MSLTITTGTVSIPASEVTILAEEDGMVVAQSNNGGIALFDEVDEDGMLLMISSGWTKSTKLTDEELVAKLLGK